MSQFNCHITKHSHISSYMCTIQENERIAKVSQKRRKEKRIDYSYAKYYYFNPM